MTPRQFRRFVAKVRFEDRDEDLGECWMWTGSLLKPSGESHNYGRFFTAVGATRLAHRVSYAHFIGPIADGVEMDHLCRQTLCVNPRHLEPVTHQQNIDRGLVPGNTHGLGHRHSIETRARLSALKREWIALHPEHVRMMNQINWKKRRALGLGGTHRTSHSAEAKAKMSAAHLAWWARKRGVAA